MDNLPKATVIQHYDQSEVSFNARDTHTSIGFIVYEDREMLILTQTYFEGKAVVGFLKIQKDDIIKRYTIEVES